MEEYSNKQRKHSGIPTIYKVGLFLIVLIFAIGMYVYFHPSFSTQVIYHGEEEVVVQAKGIMVWDEELLSSTTKGMAGIKYSFPSFLICQTSLAPV